MLINDSGDHRAVMQSMATAKDDDHWVRLLDLDNYSSLLWLPLAVWLGVVKPDDLVLDVCRKLAPMEGTYRCTFKTSFIECQRLCMNFDI